MECRRFKNNDYTYYIRGNEVMFSFPRDNSVKHPWGPFTDLKRYIDANPEAWQEIPPKSKEYIHGM